MFLGWEFDYTQKELDYIEGLLQLDAYEHSRELVMWKFSPYYDKDAELFDDEQLVEVEAFYYNEQTNEVEYVKEMVDVSEIWFEYHFPS